MPLFTSWFGQKETRVGWSKRVSVISVGAINNQLGLGASLLLMTIKAFIWFFVAMTLLNVPTMVFFYKANKRTTQTAEALSYYLEADRSDLFKKASLTLDIPSKRVFAEMSLGNLRSDLHTCALVDFKDLSGAYSITSQSPKMECAEGFIQELSYIGFIGKSKQADCSQSLSQLMKAAPSCVQIHDEYKVDEGASYSGLDWIKQLFRENCLNKASCSLAFTDTFADILKKQCPNYLK